MIKKYWCVFAFVYDSLKSAVLRNAIFDRIEWEVYLNNIKLMTDPESEMPFIDRDFDW